MNDLGNKYALAALRERRAEVAGEIAQGDRKLRSLRQALVNLDGALQLFDPNGNTKAIPAKRPYKRAKLFGAGSSTELSLTLYGPAEGL